MARARAAPRGSAEGLLFDIKLIREDPAAFDAACARRGLAPTSAQLLALDVARRALLTRLQEVQARRNRASQEIGRAKAAGEETRAAALMEEVAALKEELQRETEREMELDRQLNDALALIPNLPDKEVPDGADESANQLVRQVGEPPHLGLNRPREHDTIGEALQLMDFATAAKLSGARFVVLKGALARLERALASFMLDVHTREFGYTEVSPPLLVRDAVAYGTGNLPKFADDLFQASKEVHRLQTFLEQAKRRQQQGAYQDPAEITKLLDEALELTAAGRLWLIPTAEVSLTNLVREQILDEAALPQRFTAFTPCFRAEAGAAGKDTRGMIRQHQFSKVELVSITTPEQGAAEHERMTRCAESVLERLGLAYRTMLLCAGDMGFAAQKTYDVEVWLPGQGRYREISSCSLCGDFQARRMNARYRPRGGKGTRFVHTLNGSGLAVGRSLIAILENYQQPDGSVAIPDVLVPYMDGMRRIAKPEAGAQRGHSTQ
jgi:seryl-tRNA synthetase